MAHNNLFKWQRSSSSNVGKKENTGVQAWIKRVQAASDDASREAYGDFMPGVGDAGSMQPDDQAMYEAQELLDKWMQDQHLSNLNLEMEFKEEKWSSSTKPILNTERFTNSHLDDADSYSLSEDGRIMSHSSKQWNSEDLESYPKHYGYDDDDDVDYDKEAQEMFQKFMSNTKIETSAMSDLGMDKVTTKFKDPRPKMEQRHQIVKERNQVRREKQQKVQREKIMRKDAELMARKKIQEEEKARKLKIQNEEAAIQQEMARLRKEMEAEKLKAKEEEERKKYAIRKAKEQIILEERKKNIVKKEEEERRKIAEEKMRRNIRIEMEEKSMRETADNMRLLHKYFSCWYGVIVNRRIKIGKARAMSDWRCKLRAWNAWRAYITYIKSCQEAEEIAVAMKIKYRKEQMALKHNRLKVLKKCFNEWLLWMKERKRLQEIKQEQQRKAVKMAAFLEAAASGRLWGQEMDKEENEQRSTREEKNNKKRTEDVEEQLDDIFRSEGRVKKPLSARKGKSRPLSMTLTKKDTVVKENSGKEPNSSKHIAAEKGVDMGHSKNREKAKTDCNCAAQDMWVERRENVNYRPRNSSSKDGPKQGMLTKELKVENVEVSRKDVETKLYLENIDSASVETGTDSEKGSTQKESNELLSRRSTVKSNRSTTKPVLLPMEERAKQRAERKAILDEKRKRQDEEKLQRLKLEQEKLMIAEMQMKKERLQQKREEERIQKEREIEKKKRQEKFKESCEKADNYYHCSLLRHFGLEPWKRLIQIDKLNIQIAEKYHSRTLLGIVIAVWQEFAEESIREKQHRADECYRILLLRRSIRSWKRYGKHYGILERQATRHFSLILMKKYFNSWQYFVTNERLRFWENEEKAEEHDERRVVKSAFVSWKEFITAVKDERKREKRKEELRKKVKAWLPDFTT